MIKRRKSSIKSSVKTVKAKTCTHVRQSQKLKISKQKRPTGNDVPKNVSLREIVDTVVKVVKKPFGGKGRKKKSIISTEIQKQIDQAREIEKQEILEQREIEQTAVNPFIDFFYTQTGFIDGFEDRDILNYIHTRYPDFMTCVDNDTKSRKQILTLFADDLFVKQLLAFFELNIFDFFKFLFRLNSQVFKTAFMNKIRKLMIEMSYI